MWYTDRARDADAGHSVGVWTRLPVAVVRHNSGARRGTVAYIRTKTIKGQTYYYLVRGERHGQKVVQKVVQYLDRRPWATLPTRPLTRSHTRQDHKELFTDLLHGFGASVRFDIPFQTAGVYGQTAVSPAWVETRFREPVRAFTMAHELGHVFDHQSGWLSETEAFAELRPELQDLTDHLMSARQSFLPSVSGEVLAKRRRQAHERPRIAGLHQEIHRIEGFYEKYAYTPPELWANLFALCLTDPKRARHRAPHAADWMLRTLFETKFARKQLIEAGLWELGTT